MLNQHVFCCMSQAELKSSCLTIMLVLTAAMLHVRARHQLQQPTQAAHIQKPPLCGPRVQKPLPQRQLRQLQPQQQQQQQQQHYLLHDTPVKICQMQL